jgi:hypothetical protein
MKPKKVALAVDFIGGDKPLTAKEEKQLSDYFKNLQLTIKKSKATIAGKRKNLSKV